MDTFTVSTGCSQPSRLAPERAPVESRWDACAHLAASRFPHRAPSNWTDPFRSIQLSLSALASLLLRPLLVTGVA